MDQSLKQRLIGTTIAVALVVIFVPMLFEKSDDKGKLSSVGIPAIPDEVMEKPLELPKAPEDLAPKQEEQEGEKKPQAPSGFTIVPFNEEPPPKPKPSGQKAVNPTEANTEDGPVGVDEEKAVPAETAKPQKKPGTEASGAVPPATSGKPKSRPAGADPKGKAQPPAKAPKKTDAAPEPKASLDEGVEMVGEEEEVVPAQERQPPVSQAKPKPAAKPVPPVTKRPEPAVKPQTAKPVEPVRPAPQVARVSKPKPPTPPQEPDEKEEPRPAPPPAKPETAVAKPKPAQPAPVRRSVEPAEKKPDLAKPAPAPAKPAQTPAAAKPAPPKKPSTWVIQAGSFTDETAARTLADKLKQSKFPASVQAIHGEHGSVYRVQVGAGADRGHAEDTLKQIEGSTGINGVVTERR